MINYPYRYHLLTPASAQPALRSLLAKIWPCEPEECQNAFNTPLTSSVDPKGVPSLYSGTFAATEEHREQWEKADLPDGVKLILRAADETADEGKILDANSLDYKAKIGATWNTKDELAAIGLVLKIKVDNPTDPKPQDSKLENEELIIPK